MQNNFKYILLDWDGCLADTLGVWMNAYFTIYKEYGKDVSPTEILKHSWGNVELGPKEIGISDSNACWRKIIAKVKEDVMKVPLHNYAKELLINLHEGQFKIAIVTSSERGLIQPALAHHDLNKYIDFLITEEEVSHPKPDPEMLNKAIDHLNGERSQSMIVGDTGKDIIAGHNAGIKSALILHEGNKKYYDFDKIKLSNPDFTFSDLKNLYQFLLSS